MESWQLAGLMGLLPYGHRIVSLLRFCPIRPPKLLLDVDVRNGNPNSAYELRATVQRQAPLEHGTLLFLVGFVYYMGHAALLRACLCSQCEVYVCTCTD